MKDLLVIQPGTLRHSIQVQAPAPGASDTFGASVEPAIWSTIVTTRAAIYTAGGRETSQAAQLVSEVSHVVTIRYTPAAIMPNYRILFGARVFSIRFVENVLERNRVLNIYCLEIDGGVQS
jgi:head-tail adaptor